MEETRLTVREQLILRDIESALRRDRRLERALRDHGRRSLSLPLSVAVLGVASVILMVTGIHTSDPAVIWAFAVVWPVALIQAFRLLCRWTERRNSG